MPSDRVLICFERVSLSDFCCVDEMEIPLRDGNVPPASIERGFRKRKKEKERNTTRHRGMIGLAEEGRGKQLDGRHYCFRCQFEASALPLHHVHHV